jgi:hypothetical protein
MIYAGAYGTVFQQQWTAMSVRRAGFIIQWGRWKQGKRQATLARRYPRIEISSYSLSLFCRNVPALALILWKWIARLRRPFLPLQQGGRVIGITGFGFPRCSEGALLGSNGLLKFFCSRLQWFLPVKVNQSMLRSHPSLAVTPLMGERLRPDFLFLARRSLNRIAGVGAG